MQQKEIKFTTKSQTDTLSDNAIYKCNFCQKNVSLIKEKKHIIEKLSGDGLYCSYCLSNNFQTKISKNTLILSFRAIFGYFYIHFHKNLNKLYLSEIEDSIKKHLEIGIKNPIFRYDPESLLWFVDFSRVGKGKKRIALKEVINSVEEIITSFQPTCDLIYGYRQDKLFEKYKIAIEKFYVERYRPIDKRILMPSLSGCINGADKVSFEETRKVLF